MDWFWAFVGFMSPEEWQAAAAVATFAIATIAAVLALVQVRQARLLREEQARPYVVVYLERTEDNSLDLVVKNFGLTAARNVHLSSTPDLHIVWNGAREPLKTFELLPILAPGQDWRTIYDFADQRGRADDTTTFSVTVYSEDSHHRRLTPETYLLDANVYAGVEYMERKGMHDIGESLETIAKQTSYWTEGHHGLAVFTRDGAQKDLQSAQRMRDMRARRASQQAPVEPPPEATPPRKRRKKKPPTEQ